MILFLDESKCCGCGACVAACPKHAICMEANAEGFLYPVVEENKCISCGLCQRVCAFQHIEENGSPMAVYALMRKDKKRLKRSASGGAFAAIAEQWIKQGGCVFGAALISENGTMTPKHICAESENELLPILGSKYVQCDVNGVFSDVRKRLNAGQKVLFSGTPCQVAALKAFLGKSFDNLLTIDLVCHGVPSSKMFQEYLAVEENKLGGKIKDFKFRDKELGWGLNANIYYNANGIDETFQLPSNESSYYELFLRSEIYRKNCYYCPYANEHHPADLTIGDFWGIERAHPDEIVPKGTLDIQAGVSMLMVNTPPGADFVSCCKEEFYLISSTFEKAAKYNEQLRHPSIVGDNREIVMSLYRESGFGAVDKWFYKRRKKQKRKEWIEYHLHNDIPEPIRNVIKRILRR